MNKVNIYFDPHKSLVLLEAEVLTKYVLNYSKLMTILFRFQWFIDIRF